MREYNNDIPIYRKYKSLCFAEVVLRTHPNKEYIVKLKHRNVTLKANAEDILKYNLTTYQKHNQLPGDTGVVYHFPLLKWTFVEGDPQWLAKIYADFGWTLPKHFTALKTVQNTQDIFTEGTKLNGTT